MMRLIFCFILLFLGSVAASAPTNIDPGTTLAFVPKQRASNHLIKSSSLPTVTSLRGGEWLIPSGWNPFGYKITALGEEFLAFDGSLTCDVGRFLASLKAGRKRKSTLKAAWLEIVRASKTGQTMRIYRQIDELLAFCLKTGLID
jgi:hypothetical protein